MNFSISSSKIITAALAVVFALMVVPFAVSATTLDKTIPVIETPGLTMPSLTTSSLQIEPVTCKISVDQHEITTGGSVTVAWETTGADTIKINGESVTGESGQMTISNIMVNTVFELVAKNEKDGSCKATVNVTCIPPEVPVRCEDFGYDFQIGKYEWNNSSYEKESLMSGYSVSVNGDDNTANWTADPAVAGVIAKAATVVEEFAGGTSGVVNKSDIGSGQHGISNIAFCGKHVPKMCELTLHKTVDKTEAKPGEEITYTITIENTGTKDCTGGGVKIFDEVDDNLDYLSYHVTSNLSPGYGGKLVYTASDRTLRWNGHDLNPGEKGTIKWVGKVKTPNQCGDFEVHNKAKATAKELNSFKDWSYSNKVTTAIDYDCDVPVCDQVVEGSNAINSLISEDLDTFTVSFTNPNDCPIEVGATSYKVPVDNGQLCSWENGKLDCQVRHDFEDITLAPHATKEITVDKPQKCYQLDWYYGISVEFLDYAQFGNPLLSYVINAATGEERLFGAIFNASLEDCDYTPPVSCDFLTASPMSIDLGQSLTLEWSTTNAERVFINNGIGEVDADGSVEVSPLEDTTYLLTVLGAKDHQDWCEVKVKVDTTPEKPECPFIPGPNTVVYNFDEKLRSDQSLGNSQTKIIPTTLEAGKYNIRLASWDAYGNRDMVTQPREQWQLEFLSSDTQVGLSDAISDLEDKVKAAYLEEQVNDRYVLTAPADGVRAVHAAYVDTSSPNSVDPICAAVEKVEDPAPTCDAFTANPETIVIGSTSTLSWETSNATRVVINNGIGEVDADGSIAVSPLVDTVYQLTVFGTDDRKAYCEVPVKVSEDPIPVCVAFTANPNNLPIGGGDVTLEWEVEDATSVNISPTVGSVDLTGSTSVNVTESTTYTLTAVDTNGDEVSCMAPVTVPDPVPFTCTNNVSFGASPNSVRRGSDVTLTWNVTNADSVSISGINATSFSGSQVVTPNNDTTYVLTAVLNNQTIECPTSVTVSTGGGGGGSSSPRCELDISDERIKLGEEITLSWDTSRARDVRLTDDAGNVIFDTDDMLSDEKEDYFEGSITLSPTRDTRYTLVAERGSKDRSCRVAVEIEDDIVILETRDQQPLVAGISLSAVPYTGFEAGPFMTVLFYALLIAWAFYIAYLLVVRKQMTATTSSNLEVTPKSISNMRSAEATRPDVFVESVSAPVETQATAAPTNLPMGDTQVGYEANQVTESTVADIEDRAHAQKALLSSDAIRHFVATTEGSVERAEALDEVISEAKKVYPLEDGWIVINESRMKNLCEVCKVNAEKAPETFIPTVVPEGSSSLAEAIVTGNVVAAYEMIGHRPMFALADAAADLDSVYRTRRGEDKVVSELLAEQTQELSDEQIKNMISALTSALDGTYTNEAEAVKMAIMKAIKEVA